jgi:hypothetical protein
VSRVPGGSGDPYQHVDPPDPRLSPSARSGSRTPRRSGRHRTPVVAQTAGQQESKPSRLMTMSELQQRRSTATGTTGTPLRGAPRNFGPSIPYPATSAATAARQSG